MEIKEISRNFVDAIIESERSLISAEHIIKVIMPVVKDQKLLLRALETLHKSAVLIISSILKYEYLHKRVQLSSDHIKNLDIFIKKCAFYYGLSSEEVSIVKNLLILGKKHKESGFEFSRVGKIVIMNDDLSTIEVTHYELEQFINVLRKLVKNARVKFVERQK